MPNYKGHMLGGFLTFAITTFLFVTIGLMTPKFTEIIQYLLSALIGSLFPDIDTKSKIQKVFYVILLIILILLLSQANFLFFAILSFLGLLPLLVHHRGLFHKPSFIIFIAASLIIICRVYKPELVALISTNLLFFVFGAFSHIILDVGIRRFF